MPTAPAPPADAGLAAALARARALVDALAAGVTRVAGGGLAVLVPFTSEEMGRIPACVEDDVEAAVSAGRVWGATVRGGCHSASEKAAEPRERTFRPQPTKLRRGPTRQ